MYTVISASLRRHWLYGATKPLAALIHFTCVEKSESARAWPLRLLGAWHGAEVATVAERHATVAEEVRSSRRRSPRSRWRNQLIEPRLPRAGLLALEGYSLDHSQPIPSLRVINLLHAALGAFALYSGRRAVLPAFSCSADAFQLHRRAHGAGDPQSRSAIPSRCFWHLHAPHSLHRACVYRVGWCPDHLLATPFELDQAIMGVSEPTRWPHKGLDQGPHRQNTYVPPPSSPSLLSELPVAALDLREHPGGMHGGSQWKRLSGTGWQGLMTKNSSLPAVLLRLHLPPEIHDGCPGKRKGGKVEQQGADDCGDESSAGVAILRNILQEAGQKGVLRALHAFEKRCSDLAVRTHRRPCTVQC